MSQSGWPTVFDTVYPPAANARMDRLNDAGNPILYASTRPLTVLAELHMTEGEFVHLIGMRIKQRAGICFVAIGEWTHLFKGGFSRLTTGEPTVVVKRIINEMGLETAKRIIYVDAFLSHILADPRAAENGYLHTRALRHAIFRKRPQADGFFYPSVRDDIGMNLAIKPEVFDAKIQICMSQVMKVTRVREFGFFDIQHCRHAGWFNEDGTFEWRPDNEEHEFLIFGMTQEEEEFCRAHNDKMSGNAIMDFLDLGYAPVMDD